VSLLATLTALLLVLLLSALYSGSETGLYSLSRVRLAAEAERGRGTARVIRRLLRDETGLLVALLIGNNLMVELATRLAEGRVEQLAGVPSWGREVVTTLVLTPVLFFFAELLPKDQFRRRAHLLVGLCAPFLVLSRIVFWPLSAPLALLTTGLEHLLGVRRRELTRALARERVAEILREGTALGALSPAAGELARNVLELRETWVGEVGRPFDEVTCLDLAADPAESRRRLLESEHSRLPVLGTDPAGRRGVLGYVHQLEVLAEGEDTPLAELVRPILAVPPDLPVDRTLNRMRLAGQRIALVGRPEAPSALVSVADLVATL
jgi:CBS domain containing-hemolysin-like protein